MTIPREHAFEQIARALRTRYFKLIPKLSANWPDDQHESNRLSRSLAAYALVGLRGIDDAAAAACVTDGGDDGGIDALYYDNTIPQLIIVQSKFSRKGGQPSQADILKTINGVKALYRRQFDRFNPEVQSRLDKVEEALDTPGISIKLVIVFLSDEELGPHAVADLNDLKTEINQLNPLLSWQACGLRAVHGWLLTEEAQPTVDLEIALENWGYVTVPRKAIYGQLTAATLASLIEVHGDAIFERNIRHYLGTTDVNKAILSTVLEKPEDLFYLNNGLTAVASSIQHGAAPATRCVFNFTSFSIVNGAQTAGAVASAAVEGAIDPAARLLLTIIEVGPVPEDFGWRITQARNLQNVVKDLDFAALDLQQERLRRELAIVGIGYHYRPSLEALTRGSEDLHIAEAAMALAGLSFPILTSTEVALRKQRGQSVRNAIELIVIAKKEINRLWEKDGPYYSKLFHDKLSGLQLYRLVTIYRFIDAILSSTERSENSYLRRGFFKHGRLFIMALIAHRSNETMSRATLDLSQDDKDRLSRLVNELGELVYTETIPNQEQRGYLSSFRSLTETQLLADNVLARLAAKDHERIRVPDLTNGEQE